MERELTSEAALADVLRVLESGRDVDVAWLRERYPKHWEDLHQTLVLMSWLEPRAAPDGSAERAGPYVLEERLGEGGAGITWRARHAEAGGPDVCVKVLRPELAARRGTMSRFLREARIGLELHHPNVVGVLGTGTCRHGGVQTAYIAMEYVEGETLRERLRRDGPLSAHAALRLTRELAQGLAAIHAADALHLDVKPENILLDVDGTARITDFGVAHADDVVGRRSGFVGTLRYAAPEQFGGDVDARSDLFALGAVLHEALTGRPLRPSGTRDGVLLDAVLGPREPPALGSGRLARLVGALIEPEPDGRPHSARDVLERLSACAGPSLAPDHATHDDGAPAATELPALLSGRRRTPLIGREPQLDALAEMLTDCAAARGHVALLQGVGGVGKSRLVAELAARALVLGIRVHAVPASAPDELVRIAQESATPSFVCVEDLHAASDADRAAFSETARTLRERGWLVVGTLRPPDGRSAGRAADWSLHARVVDEFVLLQLTPLDAAQSRALFRVIAGSDPDRESAVRALFDAAQGLPLAIAFAAERAVATRSGGTPVTRPVVAGEVDVPISVLETVDDELLRMAAADRVLVGLAALCGTRPDVRLLAAARDAEPAAVRRELERLTERAVLLVRRGQEVAFSHDLVRDAVEALLPQDAARDAHAQIAEALEHTADAGEDAQRSVRVAHHWLAADAPDRARPFTEAGLEALSIANRNRELLALAERALACDDGDSATWRAQLLIYRGQASIACGELEPGLDSVAEALELTRDAPAPQRFACLRSAANFELQTGRRELAAAHVAELLELAPRVDAPEPRYHAYYLAALEALGRGDRDAVRQHEAALARTAHGQPVGMPTLILHHFRARLAAADDSLDGQLRELETVEHLAVQIDHQNVLQNIRLQRATALIKRARTGEASAVLSTALDDARAASRGMELTFLLRLEGYVRSWCGDLTHARRNFTVAARVYEQMGQRGGRAEALAGLAVTEARLGDPAAAASATRHALRLVRDAPPGRFLATALEALSSSCSYRGRTASAGRLARLSEAAARARDVPSTERGAQIRSALARGDAGEAADLLERAKSVLLGFAPVELAAAVARATGAPRDRRRAVAAVTEFLAGCSPELREIALRHAPEVIEFGPRGSQ